MRRGARCGSCDLPWPPRSRWCGRCGAPLVAVPEARRRPRVTRRAAPAALLAVGIAAGIGAAGFGAAGFGAVVTGPGDSTSARSARLAAPGAGAVAVPPRDEATTARRSDDDATGLRTIADGPVCRRGAATADCVVWDQPLSHRHLVAARVVDDQVVTVAVDGTVVARSATSGAVLWQADVDLTQRRPTHARTTHGGAPSGPVEILDEVSETVPVRVGDRVVFLALGTGQVLSEVAPPTAPTRTAGDDPWLLVTDGTTISNLGATGTSTFTVSVPPDHHAWVTGHGAYLTSGTAVTALSGDVGSERWTHELAGPVRPLQDGVGDVGMHALDGDAPALVGLARDDGALRWSVRLGGPVVEVTVAEDRLAILTDTDTGPEVVLATVADTGAVTTTGTIALGEDVSGVQAPALSNDTVAIVAANPRPVVTVATVRGQVRYARQLATVPYGIRLPGESTLLLADVTGLRATALGSDVERYRVQLRRPEFLAGADTLLLADHGVTRVRPRPSGDG